ncbi:MAG: OmpA family protein [Planctomycetes bacterium]|nr:OmpA family protein [Planctomycetota bacterium]MCB9909986.1 OmpA family protein [Planctomycetota bacterium]HPF12720.1 flagellar motor protein MotB [Planctomycetota bacterium]HRV80383.1 flagellar motor protein MotB [Planctomycetota bacterium]
MRAAPEPVVVKVVDVIVKKKGAPGYMVSFGDMMTLILCFFILLVSMAKERNYGMLAKGIGSFVVQLKSHGLTGVLSGSEKEAIFEQVRRRFNLPPEPDPERQAEHSEASDKELLRAETLELLQPHREVATPRVAGFTEGSALLSDASRRYLDQLAPTLRPRRGQLLVLEGHALESTGDLEPHQLALARAMAVRDYLIGEHDFPATRVEARVWLDEFFQDGANTRSVDARLVTANG